MFTTTLVILSFKICMCIINTRSVCFERLSCNNLILIIGALSAIYLVIHLYCLVRFALAYCSVLTYLALSWAITDSCSCDRWDQISLPHVIPLTSNRGRLFIAPLHANLTGRCSATWGLHSFLPLPTVGKPLWGQRTSVLQLSKGGKRGITLC